METAIGNAKEALDGDDLDTLKVHSRRWRLPAASWPRWPTRTPAAKVPHRAQDPLLRTMVATTAVTMSSTLSSKKPSQRIH